ncbi:MAG: fibronectin type III domain-containing protein [Bacteroidales bacterium]|nr:fibronectin type III domain-containing protein [Bacteroidales bacterium]
MKRTLLSLLSILILSTTVKAQEEVLVANGTATNQYVPVYGYMCDNYIRCQIIYPADMLEDMGGQAIITSLKWFLSSPASSTIQDRFQIKLGETSQTSFQSTSWLNSSSFTTVYTGTLNLTSSICEVIFSNSYTYEGGNLVVEIDGLEDLNFSSTIYYGVESTGGSLSGYSYNSWESASGTVRNFIPKTEFTAEVGEITCRKPENLTVFTLSRTGASIGWDAPATTNPGSYYFEYRLAGSNNWIGETTRDPYIFLTGLSQESQYDVRVRSICGVGDTSSATRTSFSTPGCNVELSGGNTTSSYVPFYGYYSYGYSQMLYSASVLSPMDTIWGVKFYLTSANSTTYTFDLYIANTTTSSVSLSSYVASSQLTRVVQNRQISFTQGWNYIEFTTPFIYDGSSNIVVAFDNNTGSYSSGISFAHYSGAGCNSCYWYQDGGDIYPSSPSALSSNTMSTVPAIQFVISCSQDNCQAPLLLVNEVESHSVMLRWQPMGTASSWKVEYKEGVTGNWVTANANVTQNEYELSGLNAGVTYQFRVSSNCSSTYNSSTVSAFTKCDLFDVTYREDFSSGSINPCWAVSQASMNYPTVVSGVLYTGPDDNAWVILPEFSEEVTNLMLTLTAEHSATTGTLTIGITDGLSINTFEEVETFEYTTDVTEIESYLDVYTGSGTNIALKFNSGNTNIDNIVVSRAPSCRRPNHIRVVEADASTATLTWDAGANTTGAIVKYRRTGARWNTVEATGTTVTLTDLVANKQYEVIVKAICDNGSYSDESETFTFRTGCADGSTPVTERYPFIEDFENGIYCWQQEFEAENLEWVTQKGDGETNAGAHGIDTAYLGRYNAVLYNLLVYTSGPKTRLISPVINTESLEEPWLRYAYGLTKYTDRQTGQQFFDEMSVYYRTTATGPWVQLKNYTSATTGWILDSVALPATSSTFQISFLGYFKKGNGVALDDVRVYTRGHDSRVDDNPPVTGIDELDAEESWSFRIFPNPASGSSMISLTGVTGKVNIAVMDMSGRMVRTESMECYEGCEHRLELQGLAQGAYFVRVTGDQVNSVKKLIVK